MRWSGAARFRWSCCPTGCSCCGCRSRGSSGRFVAASGTGASAQASPCRTPASGARSSVAPRSGPTSRGRLPTRCCSCARRGGGGSGASSSSTLFAMPTRAAGGAGSDACAGGAGSSGSACGRCSGGGRRPPSSPRLAGLSRKRRRGSILTYSRRSRNREPRWSRSARARSVRADLAVGVNAFAGLSDTEIDGLARSLHELGIPALYCVEHESSALRAALGRWYWLRDVWVSQEGSTGRKPDPNIGPVAREPGSYRHLVGRRRLIPQG